MTWCCHQNSITHLKFCQGRLKTQEKGEKLKFGNFLPQIICLCGRFEKMVESTSPCFKCSERLKGKHSDLDKSLGYSGGCWIQTRECQRVRGAGEVAWGNKKEGFEWEAVLWSVDLI